MRLPDSRRDPEYRAGIEQWMKEQGMSYLSNSPNKPTESAQGRADQINNHVKMLIQQVSDLERFNEDLRKERDSLRYLELRNAELESELAEAKSVKGDYQEALVDAIRVRDELRKQMVAGRHAALEDKIRRHIEKYRRKRQNANNDGDLMAGAAADQRLRALEDLLNS